MIYHGASLLLLTICIINLLSLFSLSPSVLLVLFLWRKLANKSPNTLASPWNPCHASTQAQKCLLSGSLPEVTEWPAVTILPLNPYRISDFYHFYGSFIMPFKLLCTCFTDIVKFTCFLRIDTIIQKSLSSMTLSRVLSRNIWQRISICSCQYCTKKFI